MSNFIAILLIVAVSNFALSSAITYDRCQLSRDLLNKYRFPADQISQWVCLARWESEYNTSAIGSLNADGSLDHGLFQISDKYWCYGPGLGEACGIHCDQLRDDDIKDDVTCVKRIFRSFQRMTGNGFNAWVAWKVHCQGNTDAYTEGCFVDENKVETKQSSQPTTVTDNKRPDWLSHFIALTDLLPFVSK